MNPSETQANVSLNNPAPSFTLFIDVSSPKLPLAFPLAFNYSNGPYRLYTYKCPAVILPWFSPHSSPILTPAIISNFSQPGPPTKLPSRVSY
ncbi:hypothetical protein ACTXT7_005981 [Hymenolepis weldensis]